MSRGRRIALTLALSLSSLAGSADIGQQAGATRGVYRIMALGDSITVGVGQDPVKKGYRVNLANTLKVAAPGFRHEFVGTEFNNGAHEGHGGWTIEQIRASLPAWIVASRPDVVLLHVGTNNVTRGDSPSKIEYQLRHLLADLKKLTAARVFLATPVGVRDVSPRESWLNHQLDDIVRRVGPGAGVSVVDMHAVRGLALYDHHHPNAYGYRLMAYAWYEALRGVMPGSNRWADASDPTTWPKHEVCQYNYETRRKVCLVRGF